jgi:hypothetical protein
MTGFDSSKLPIAILSPLPIQSDAAHISSVFDDFALRNCTFYSDYQSSE